MLYKIALPTFIPLVKKRSIFPYYHLITNEKVAHICQLYPYKNVEAFKKDLTYLKQHYMPLSPGNLLSSEGSPNIPKNSFLLTFDDGLSEIYTTVFPILKENNLSAIFFLNPDFIDNTKSLYKHSLSVIVEHLQNENISTETLDVISGMLGLGTATKTELTKKILQIKKRDLVLIEEIATELGIDLQAYVSKHRPYLTKSQIEEMMAAGFYFGGHTLSHPRLTELPLEQQKKEVIDSIKWVKETFGISYSSFAFPFSDKGISKALIKAIFEYDPKAIVFGNSGFRKDIHPRVIQRFSIEDPTKKTARTIITENLYLLFNKLTGTYTVKRS